MKQPGRSEQPISPLRAASSLTETWSPRVIAELDDYYVKVAKLEGEFEWHAHLKEDELFYVLQGCLHIELADRTLTLQAGDLFVVPRGVRHKPWAEGDCLVMLVEQRTTAHTGEASTALTRSLEDQLRPIGDLDAAAPSASAATDRHVEPPKEETEPERAFPGAHDRSPR